MTCCVAERIAEDLRRSVVEWFDGGAEKMAKQGGRARYGKRGRPDAAFFPESLKANQPWSFRR